jgi:restriction endonuclease Mrr
VSYRSVTCARPPVRRFLVTQSLHCQFKRYAPGNQVGSPVVRDLRGTMVREGAEFGFLVVTSTFTQNAIEEARREPRVALFDVRRLNRLVDRLEREGRS